MADSNRISDLRLEQLVLGELSPEREKELRDRLAGDADACARLAAIEHDNAAFGGSHSVDRATREIERRTRQRARRGRTRSAFFIFAPALAGAFVIAIFVRTPVVVTDVSDPEVTRLKGLAPRLLVFQKQAHVTRAAALSDGATVHAHDLVQTGYVAAGRRYGAVLSLDGRGNVVVHSPLPGRPAELDTGGQVLLPNAYELDDAPRFERFFLVTSARPFALDLVMAAARDLAAQPDAARTGRLALPASLEQTSLLLNKAAQPDTGRP